MGLFKKIFKPVAKVLDKVIPNEIKPALPYLAAFAPVFGPAGMQSFIGSTMGRRALTSGLMNIGAQLAQEGNEGDINLLSAGLGALSGAMTVPGGSDTIAGSRIVGTGADGKAITASEYAKLSEGANLGSGMVPSGGLTADLTPAVTSAPFKGPVSFSQVVPGGEAGVTGLAKARNIGLDFLGKGSDFLKVGEGGGTTAKLLSKEGLQVAAAPAAQATGDLMQAEARQLEKQAAIDAALAEAEALADAGLRGDAIRNAMRAYGFFSDEEIEDTVSSAGYRAGGRVGYRFGGMDAAIDAVENENIKESVKMIADMPDMDLMDLIEEFEIIFKRKPMSMDELKQFYRENYEMESPVRMREKIKEKVTVEAKDGGLMDLGGKEMDLRGGGFVPIGKKERADDVPARLSKNEFVMTADAVRAAGGGSVNKGAKRMYNLMNNLEARA
jgi:hypothetical protein